MKKILFALLAITIVAGSAHATAKAPVAKAQALEMDPNFPDGAAGRAFTAEKLNEDCSRRAEGQASTKRFAAFGADEQRRVRQGDASY